MREDDPAAAREVRLRPGEQAEAVPEHQDATFGKAAMNRKLRMAAREDALAQREEAVARREEALAQREEAVARREEAVRAREADTRMACAPQPTMAQIREANEHLIVASVRAQALSEAAEEANHLKDEFLATVSHELRTPLNAVLGWTRMLESKQLPPARAEHALAAIGRSASALAQIVDDLLDTSRILKGAVRMTRQPVDLAVVTRAALDAVRPLADARKVQLAFEPTSGQRTVSGDASRLQQVIWNLLANAVKFTPEGGQVRVFIESSNDHVEVRVVDTGEGISPDFLPHVFERFRQADSATTARHTGLGLGLGIVLQLVELHGGTVHAASPGLGQGATFTVRLPIPAGEAPAGPVVALVERRTAPSTTPAPPRRLERLDGLRILVVDDDPDERTLASVVLTQAGATVQAAASAREALHALEINRPDALVSDVDLPGEDGYALIRQVRQYEAEHGGFVPAIALTAHARAEDRARTLAAGFQVHAPKPIEPAALTAAIAAMGGLPRRHPGGVAEGPHDVIERIDV